MRICVRFCTPISFYPYQLEQSEVLFDGMEHHAMEALERIEVCGVSIPA